MKKSGLKIMAELEMTASSPVWQQKMVANEGHE